MMEKEEEEGRVEKMDGWNDNGRNRERNQRSGRKKERKRRNAEVESRVKRERRKGRIWREDGEMRERRGWKRHEELRVWENAKREKQQERILCRQPFKCFHSPFTFFACSLPCHDISSCGSNQRPPTPSRAIKDLFLHFLDSFFQHFSVVNSAATALVMTRRNNNAALHKT